jgi:hypothetical protein
MSASNATTTIAGRKPHAFSSKTQRRVLSMLRRRAMGGDVEAAESLLRLAREAASERAPILSARSALD